MPSSEAPARGISPQRALFVRYIESLGIKVNYEGTGPTGAVTVSIKDEAGTGAWDGANAQNQDLNPKFG